MAVIVMSNGDAYHVTEQTAEQVAEALSLPATRVVSLLDKRSGKRVTIVLGKVSSVVRDEQ